MQNKRSIEIGQFDATLRGLILPMGLRVDSVKIFGRDLTISHDPFSSKSDEKGKLEVFVSEGDLTAFLAKMPQTGLKNVSVEAKDGSLHIRATKTMIIDVKAYAVCSIRIADGSKLFVDLESVEVMGVGPKQLIQSQLDKINPVLDTADFPIKATMDSVEVAQGGILLRGWLDPNV